MSTQFSGVKCGQPIEADWELERDLWNWGVMPQHQAIVMDLVNAHLMESHEQFSTIVIAVDSEFPSEDEVTWEKTNPALNDEEGLGNYIHLWTNPEDGMLAIIVIRPDLQEYDEPAENEWEPEEERTYPGNMTETEWLSAHFGEEG